MVTTTWAVAGSYFEACNCDAICPCRQLDGRPGGRSTHGICEFALSWCVDRGRAGDVELAGREVVLAGWYDDDEPGSPWRVVLWVDDDADDDQTSALADIFLGRAGGTTMTNFGRAIGEVHAVHRARIDLDHRRGRRTIRVDDAVEVRAERSVAYDGAVTCGIPGHDRPGEEVVSDILRVEEPPLTWSVTGRCGFATDFDYRSDD